MPTRRITVTLEIDDAGNVALVDEGSMDSALVEPAASAKRKKDIIDAPVVPDEDWIHGYDPAFLTDPDQPVPALIVPLPRVRDPGLVAPIVDATYKAALSAEEAAQGVLKYNGFSVAMHAGRRFAFYSAANVDGGMRPMISGREDHWLADPRIARSHQVDNSYYKNNKFDRGHLTRRDDMEWGREPREAVRRANGTCTWTNCAPQHEIFNQGKDSTVLLWQNLEKYILEQTAAEGRFRVQVITGPVFGEADPVYRGLGYPLEFWKVVAAVGSAGSLFATAYLLNQKATIDKFGLDAALQEPFGTFGAYQVAIREIERLTGLDFRRGPPDALRPLSNIDPLERRGGTGAAEAFTDTGGRALQSFEDIVLA